MGRLLRGIPPHSPYPISQTLPDIVLSCFLAPCRPFVMTWISGTLLEGLDLDEWHAERRTRART